MGCNTSKHVDEEVVKEENVENNNERVEEEEDEEMKALADMELEAANRPNEKYPPFLNGVAWEPEKVDKEGGVDIDYKLELEWIHGASKKNTKGNLCGVNAEGNLVYSAAAVGVVYNPKDHTQRFVTGHTDDIVCLDMHPDGTLVATGSRGKDDEVHIWDTTTMETKAVLKTSFTPGGVVCVSFCRTNPSLIAVLGGNNENQKLQIWKWEDEEKTFEQDKIASTITYSFLFNNENRMVWTGKNGVQILTMEDGALDAKRASLSSNGGEIQRCFASCMGDAENKTVVGTKSGDLYVLEDHNLTHIVKAHKGSCRALSRCKGGFVSVGADGNCRTWTFDADEGVKPVRNVQLRDYGRAVCANDDMAYVFEKDGDVVAVNFEDDSSEIIMYGHASSGEAWCLDVVGDRLYTGSDDGRIVVVDNSTNKKIGEVKGKLKPRDIDVSPDNQFIAVASSKGTVFILARSDLEKSELTIIKDLDVAKRNDERVEAIRFSPDGKWLAVGSADTTLNIYEVAKDFKRVARLSDHTSTIFNLSWDEESKHIVTTCRAYEVLYWGRNKRGRWRRLPYPSTLADEDWHDYSCTLGWKVRGVWDMSDYNDGTDINQLAVDKSRNLIAAGDDHGKIVLVRFPTLYQLPPREMYSGHASHITRVKFSGDYLYSAGGFDECFFKWKVVPK
mmetsp:Transcript_7809/g.11582  ORF Transcript_7809/g.11582 Transcript_7809/m.11582 type:complete len:673 (+) Transcript_7809:52-2070(+)